MKQEIFEEYLFRSFSISKEKYNKTKTNLLEIADISEDEFQAYIMFSLCKEKGKQILEKWEENEQQKIIRAKKKAVNIKYIKKLYSFPEFVNVKHIEYNSYDEYRIYEHPIKTRYTTISKNMHYIEKDGEEYHSITGAKRTEESKQNSIKNSIARTKRKIYDYAFSNDWTNGYFFTITFNPEYVDSYNYDECLHRIKTFLKVTKRNNPNFKYIFVPEKHKSGRFHFHGIGVNCDNLKLEYSGITYKKDKIYNINTRSYKYGFTTVSKIKDTNKVSNYITKYITKDLISSTKNRHRYLFSANLDAPLETNHFEKDISNLTKSLEEKENFICKKEFESEQYGKITYIRLKN